jgi:hypothetical protein
MSTEPQAKNREAADGDGRPGAQHCHCQADDTDQAARSEQAGSAELHCQPVADHAAGSLTSRERGDRNRGDRHRRSAILVQIDRTPTQHGARQADTDHHPRPSGPPTGLRAITRRRRSYGSSVDRRREQKRPRRQIANPTRARRRST